MPSARCKTSSTSRGRSTFFFWLNEKMSGFPWHSFPIFVTIELYRWNHLAISGKIGQTSTSFTFFSLKKKSAHLVNLVLEIIDISMKYLMSCCFYHDL